MTFIESMRNRYTTKKYDNTKKVSDQDLEDLKQIVRLSPSSINSQPWKFTFIRDQDVKERLAPVSWLNAEKVINCDTVVVFSRIDDVALFEKQIEEELSEGAVNYYKEFLKPLPESEIKAWFGRQLYLSIGVFLSACATMGIDSTPMEGIEPENYDQILALDGYTTLAAVAIGYRDVEDFNQPSKNPKSRIAIDKILDTI